MWRVLESSLLKPFNKFCISHSKFNLSSNIEPTQSRKKSNPRGYWQNDENVHKFLNDLKTKLQLNTPNDWDSIKKNQIISLGGRSLLNTYSLSEIKTLGCPEGNSYFKKTKKPSGFWDNQENIQNFIEYIRKKLNLKTPKDWNSLTINKIHSIGGTGVLKKYSINDIKVLGCPEGKSIYVKQIAKKIPKQKETLPATKKIEKKPPGYWRNNDNIQNYLIELSEKLNLKTFEDWNLINSKDIEACGGGTLLKLYSLYDIKCFGFPQGKENFKKPKMKQQYPMKPFGFWDNKDNIQEFLNELKLKFNLQSAEDWNKITKKQIENCSGPGLFKSYSLVDIKCMGCNDFHLYKPIQKNLGYWNNIDNVHSFIDDLKSKLNLKSPEDWNLITKKQIHFHGGNNLFKLFSLLEFKCIACPEGIGYFLQTNKTKQSAKPQGYWQKQENIDEFVKYLSEKLSLKSEEDWNRVSKVQIESFGGRGFFPIKNNLDPNIPQTKNKELVQNNLAMSGRSSQRWLFLQIQKIFPHEEIVEDYFHSEISRKSGSKVQFDIFLIERKIAFEYHGKHHYEDIPSGFAPVEMYKTRDEEKIRLCKQFGITLIIIPYWWDNQIESLQKTIEEKIPNFVK